MRLFMYGVGKSAGVRLGLRGGWRVLCMGPAPPVHLPACSRARGRVCACARVRVGARLCVRTCVRMRVCMHVRVCVCTCASCVRVPVRVLFPRRARVFAPVPKRRFFGNVTRQSSSGLQAPRVRPRLLLSRRGVRLYSVLASRIGS